MIIFMIKLDTMNASTWFTVALRSAKTCVYTIGHILIALSCAVIITGASVESATVDAFVEPLINAGWFFLLDLLWGNGDMHAKTIIYTLGHIAIAIACIIIITGSDFTYAFIDAVIEPLINAGWYYLLEALWQQQMTIPNRKKIA